MRPITPVTLSLVLCLLATAALPPAARGASAQPERIRQLEAGEIDVANAAWWGFDAEDATEPLQAAIDSGASTLIVPDMGEPWRVRPIRLASDQKIIFEDGVVILAKQGHYHGRRDMLFVAFETENVTLRGPNATLRMRKDEYRSEPYEHSEWRHALGLFSVRNFTVTGLTLESSGGDGIYIGRSGVYHELGPASEDALPYCENVTIRDVVCRDHHRQGISVISARDLLIENTVMAETGGTPPAAGIDFEPNRADGELVNVVMRNCETRDNAGSGYVFYLPHLNAESEPISIRLENCRSVGDRDGFSFAAGAGVEEAVRGRIDVIDSTFERNRSRAITIRGKPAEGADVRIADARIVDPMPEAPRATPIMLRTSPGATRPVGGVTFENVTIHDPLERTPIGYTDQTGGMTPEAITGTLHLAREDGTRSITLTPALLEQWFDIPDWRDLPELDLAGLTLQPRAPRESDAAYDFAHAPVRGREAPATYLLHADANDEVRLEVEYRQVGSSGGDVMPLRITGPDQEQVLEDEVAFGETRELRFRAPATGLHRLVAEPDRHSIVVRHSSHPLALSTAGTRVNVKRAAGVYYLWVPPGTREFAVEISGEGAGEGLQAELVNPQGQTVEQHEDFAEIRQLLVEYPDAAPSRGEVWQLRIEAPADMYFGDQFIRLRGVPPLLAASPDALLVPEP